MLRARPDVLFCFGDNLIRRGLGGLAKQCRGEPNAVGIPTKRYPTMKPDAFLTDADYDEVLPLIDDAFNVLDFHLNSGGTIVLPYRNGVLGIGTGLADLPKSAPKIWSYILYRVNCLEQTERAGKLYDAAGTPNAI